MSKPFTYKEAGVDTQAASSLVGDIGALRKRTEGKRRLFQPFGLFAASVDLEDYQNPILVTGCDGVGTKLELLLRHDALETAGKDLVAMNVNDVLTTGADPLVFLDYVGVGKIDPTKITRIIAGMVDHLESCGCILGGGETAEMPGLVADDMIELSGFCVGAAEREALVDPASVAVGDVFIGCPSAGFHANGFSLVRKVLAMSGEKFSDDEMASLLAPTRLYHEELGSLRRAAVPINAMAHITGGGLPENLERLLHGKGASLRVPEWENASARKILHHVETAEAFRTFNMGFGWVFIVAPDQADKALAALPPGCRILGEVLEKDAPFDVQLIP